MARFDVEGLDALVEDMKSMGELSGEVADAMLLAGAEEVKAAWKAEAERRTFRDIGDMIDSIDYAKEPKTVADVRMIDIYPQGSVRRGKRSVRNAEKAFILHYGTTSSKARRRRKNKKFSGPGIPRTLWIDDADRASGPRVMEAMTAIWDQFLEGSK